MKKDLIWIFFLLVSCASAAPRPQKPPAAAAQQEQVISVRITSSVAVGRGKGKPHIHNTPSTHPPPPPPTPQDTPTPNTEKQRSSTTLMPTQIAGANMEFIKQLHSKKEPRGLQRFERIHSFNSNGNEYSNDTDDSVAEPSVKSVLEFDIADDGTGENIENIPLARSVLSSSSNNYIQGLTRKPISERGNNQRLTTVSFNIVHDTPKVTTNYNEPDAFVTPGRDETKFYQEPAKVYSQPSQVYSEPAKFYSEPAKIYSEPAKIYGEPAKIYSEPAKIYGEPAKFYSEPASLHLPAGAGERAPWRRHGNAASSTTVTTTPSTTIGASIASSRIPEHQPERNYEVDEKVSVLTDGRSHGVQEASTESCRQENCKVGYVVEGRQYRKYRVEERTPDGFIVGEYGVVRHEDGALRGVRYTADGDASPRLIYDALMKFLQLK